MWLHRYIRLFTLLCSLIGCAAAVARSGPGDTLQFNLTKDLSDQLLSIEELYQLALANSPAIREQRAIVDVQLETNRLSKLSLLTGVGASAGYSRGNQSLIASGINVSNAENIQISNGYRMGVQVNISVANLLGYRTNIRQGQAAYRSAVAKQDGIKLGLRREISQVYQALLTSQKIVNAYIQEEQKALVVYQTAELDWHNGRLDAAEYAGASSRYTDIHIKTETARGTLISNLYDLCALVGVDMIRLKAP
jgi:outer membrane protein TolC